MIAAVKKKREFSQLPDSIVEKVSEGTKDFKETRALLRKYFGVFLTNKVIKGKGSAEEILRAHISSKKRNYLEFYKKIMEDVDTDFNSVIDLGAGVNGYSYNYLREILGDVDYFAVEASGQLVDNMNSFFNKNNFNCKAICGDLLDLDFIEGVFKKAKGKKIIFLFQVIDALENLERNFSKKFLEIISKRLTKKDLIILTVPIESLSGRINFKVRRKWLLDFLEENFIIEKDFLMNGERIIRIRKK